MDYVHSSGPSTQGSFDERPRRKRRGILKTRFDFTPQAAGNQTRKRLKLGIVALASVGVLLALDYFPRFFPARCHNFLGAFPLAMIAFAYIVYQCALTGREGIR
jgi:hypothetical protein